MILIDSSVLADFFRARVTPHTSFLRAQRRANPFAVGDLVLMEVLQGARSDAHASTLLAYLSGFPVIDLGGRDLAIAAAQNYRRLRAVGITPRKTIDTLIATRCLMDGLTLLHADRDFDPFETHLGLSVVKP